MKPDPAAGACGSLLIKGPGLLPGPMFVPYSGALRFVAPDPGPPEEPEAPEEAAAPEEDPEPEDAPPALDPPEGPFPVFFAPGA